MADLPTRMESLYSSTIAHHRAIPSTTDRRQLQRKMMALLDTYSYKSALKDIHKAPVIKQWVGKYLTPLITTTSRSTSGVANFRGLNSFPFRFLCGSAVSWVFTECLPYPKLVTTKIAGRRDPTYENERRARLAMLESDSSLRSGLWRCLSLRRASVHSHPRTVPADQVPR